jgi:hypothetical protein
MTKNNQPALVRDRFKNRLYLTTDGKTFKNLETGVSGPIHPDLCRANFTIPVLLNSFAIKNPLLIDLIEGAKLTLDI